MANNFYDMAFDIAMDHIIAFDDPAYIDWSDFSSLIKSSLAPAYVQMNQPPVGMGRNKKRPATEFRRANTR